MPGRSMDMAVHSPNQTDLLLTHCNALNLDWLLIKILYIANFNIDKVAGIVAL